MKMTDYDLIKNGHATSVINGNSDTHGIVRCVFVETKKVTSTMNILGLPDEIIHAGGDYEIPDVLLKFECDAEDYTILIYQLCGE